MTFPDIEAMAIAYLAEHIDIDIVTSVPNNRPGRFVRLWRNGGASMNRVVDRPQLTVEAWSPDSVDAAALINQCRRLLLDASTHLPLVRGVYEVSGPYRVDDEPSETPRYRFTVALTVRASR